MHRLDLRTYAGTPQEMATIATSVQGGGKVVVELDGQDIGEQRRFPLKDKAGDQTEMRITLFGAVGESCTVGVSTVDNGTDGDLLLCQVHDPFPLHRFHFLVASQAAHDALSLTRSRGGAAPATAAKKRPGRRG